MGNNTNRSIRFFDWNSLLGTILVTIVFTLLIGSAIRYPDIFLNEETMWYQIIVYLSPFMMAYAWHRLTIYLDFGGKITFRKLWTKRTYEWDDIASLAFEVEHSSYLLGLIKYENLYLTFEMLRNGKAQEFTYLLSKKNQHELVDMVKIARPDLDILV
ncbi:MAG: hypothetical protein ACSHX8_02225 [Opitutaceae bacterium]